MPVFCGAKAIWIRQIAVFYGYRVQNRAHHLKENLKLGGNRCQRVGRIFHSSVLQFRARRNFRGCLPQSSLKYLGQILTVLAFSGHLERFSPGQNGPEVGCPVRLSKVT